MIDIYTNAVQASGHDVVCNILQLSTNKWFDNNDHVFKNVSDIAGTNANIAMSGYQSFYGYIYHGEVQSSNTTQWTNGDYMFELWDITTSPSYKGVKIANVVDGADVSNANIYKLLSDHEAAMAAFRASFGNGSGINDVEIVLKENNTSGAPIYGEIVRVFDYSTNRTFAQGYTNPSGLVTFALDNSPSGAPYSVLIGPYTHHSYSGLPIQMVVNGFTHVEYYGVPMSFPSPTGVNTCVLYDWCYKEDGTPHQGSSIEVELSASDAVWCSGCGWIVRDKIRTSTDIEGFFSIELIQSDKIIPSTGYKVYIKDAFYSKKITIPNVSSIRLKDL